MTHIDTHREVERICAFAKEKVGEALRFLAEIKDETNLDVGKVSVNFANALAALFEATSKPTEGFKPSPLSQCAKNALASLRGAFNLLQACGAESEPQLAATETVAKVLAALYPLSTYRDDRLKRTNRAISSQSVSPNEEKRRTERIDLETEIGFQSKTNFYVGNSSDISTGGIFIVTDEPGEIGQEVFLNFTLPGGLLISTTGIIQWIRTKEEAGEDRDPGMGIRFVGLETWARLAIRNFIKYRSPLKLEDPKDPTPMDSF